MRIFEGFSIRRYADYIGVFAVVAAIFGYVNASPTFLDPDSFYHVKISEIMAEQGIVRTFSWLPYTTLAHNYADHHFLYHLLLIPFLKLYGSLVGAKVATVALAAGAVTAFYGALKTYQSRYPFAFAMLLACSSAFVFRTNLTKTSAISVLALMLALIVIRKEKPWLLFVLSWLYVWTYGGWPLMALIIGAFLLARAVADRLLEKHPLHSWGYHFFWKRCLNLRKHALADFFAVAEVKHGIAVAAGLVCGLVINPFFPANLLFYWEQIVQIAVLNYKETIGVGAEWYPYTLLSFYKESSLLFLVPAMLLVLWLAMLLWPEVTKLRPRPQSRKELSSTIAIVVLAVVFFFLTLRSKRHVEYFSPFGSFAVALLFTAIDARMDWPELRRMFREIAPKVIRRFIAVDTVLAVFMFATLIFIGVRNIDANANTYRGGISWKRYERAAAWMRENIPAGEIIVHSDWDQFPVLFYWNAEHRYVCGLDPTFLYRQDPERYWLWVNVTTGRLEDNVAERVRDGLGARYFFVDQRYSAMRAQLERNANIVLLYHDDEASVYVIR